MHIHMSRAAYRIHKCVNEIYKFMGNYIHYLMRFHSHNMAWSMAKKTL